MKGSLYLILLNILFIFIVSCSPVPKPTNHPFTTQTKLEAAQHWKILARDFTRQIAIVMKRRTWDKQNFQEFSPADENNSTGSFINLPSIYIQTNDVSDFGISFRSYLITELSKLGYVISYSPEDSLMARWSVKKIHHNADRTAAGLPVKNTMAVAIGGGVFQIFNKNSYIFPGLIATGVTADLLNNTKNLIMPGKVPHTEIVLTFTISTDAQILSRHSQAYYVNEKDFDHYRNIADYAGEKNSLKSVKFNVTNQ